MQGMATERAVLVTGGSSGIGAAICRAMARPGTRLGIHARQNRDGAERTAAAARAEGAEAHVLLADLAAPGAAEALVEQATTMLGGLDVVVSNAGFADRTPVAALTDEGFARTQDVVLWALLRLARASGPWLARGQSPRFVAVSSFVAHSFRPDATLFPATAAAKAGVEALVKALAVEWAPGVTVNAVAPGYIRKDAQAHAAVDAAARDAMLSRIPLGRIGLPEEVAAAVAFLASPAAGYITGQVLHVNGGLVI
jgi:NAD(P)-dependent dehydrogenase (short-subunit alcohol dehydrogenase family)